MKYQKIKHFSDDKPNWSLNIGQKIELKWMMIHMDSTGLVVELDLRYWCSSQFYVIIVMYIYL